MRLSFKGGKTSQILTLDTSTKTYTCFSGVASDCISLDTFKELKQLEIKLIREGYKNN